MPSPTPPPADRNLLLGVLALQLDFLDRDALIAGMNAWALDKGKPLGRVLCEQGALPPARLGLLDALVEEHVGRHGGDARASLAAAASGSTLSGVLDAVADPAVRTTLSDLAGPVRRVAPPVRDGVRFRNLRPHARGGLGEVFVADDAELGREVAVKEIQLHRADDPASRARFVREAEITGALEHPGVIPVYALGAHPDGRPYYAMRFVRGETLKAAIDRHHALPPAARPAELRRLLGRLIDVCNAVAYAHSRGVVHRDLKPANVLLGPFGETLVVDWGLAKAGVGRHTDDDATTDPTVRPSGSDAPTRPGSALGTPGYMSPEQAAGRHDAVGPASDVFGLGATLYCLLTGRKPFEGTTVEDEVAQTRKCQFRPPREVNRDVPPALEAICRKALALDPADRYPSPLGLAADLERWLADEPVGVYRDPWPVRAGRWARRHRPAVAAAAVLLVTATVASGLGTWLVWNEERRTAEQKRQAEENFALARDLTGGFEILAANEAAYAADPAQNKARKEVLVAAAKASHKLVDRQPDDADVRRQAARVYRFTANVHRLERDHPAAEVLYADAVDLLEKLRKEFPEDPAYPLQLSETLRDQAKVQSTLGRLADAVKALDRVIDLADAVLAVGHRDAWARRARAAGLLSRAGAQYTRGRLAEAGADARAAADLFEALDRAPADAHAYDRLLQAAAVNILALVERESGRPEDALPLHVKATELADPLAKESRPDRNPDDVANFRAAFWLEQARTWARLDRRLEAIRVTGLTAGEWDRLVKKKSAVAEAAQMSGVAYYERGRARLADRRTDEARADFEKSLGILKAEVQKAPDVPELSGDLGRTYGALARLARAGGDGAKARDLFREATAALKSAVDRAPERARDVRDLQEVEAEVGR
jgi:tetratricopeptide (TPR) repeat protein/tRNA A-37 threonylcarbamoyl transferase component Bud32